MKTKLRKTLSILVIAALLFETADLSAFAEVGRPLSIDGLAITQESYDAGPDAAHVYFIQDAHDSPEAQKNIASMIKVFVESQEVKKVFEEGYEGEVPVDKYFGKAEGGVKKRAADYYLDQLWIGGAEYARILAKEKFTLIGAEDAELYFKNLRQYQEAARYQQLVEKELSQLRKAVLDWADKNWTRDQKEIFSIWSRHAAGQIDFLSKATRLAEILKGKKAETDASRFFTGLKKGEGIKGLTIDGVLNKSETLEAEAVEAFFTGDAREAYENLKQLELLERLNRFEVGTEHFKDAVKILDAQPTQKMARWAAKRSDESIFFSKAWETLVRAAVDFYETAQQRDTAVLRNLKKLKPGEKAVLVFGGFHKENLARLMHEAKIGYTVLMPRISGLSTKHQELYRERMSAPISIQPSPALAARSMSGFFAAEQRLPLPDNDPFSFFDPVPGRSEARNDSERFVLDFLAHALDNFFDPTSPRHALKEKREGNLEDILAALPEVPANEMSIFQAGENAYREGKLSLADIQDPSDDEFDRAVIWQQNAKEIRKQLKERKIRSFDREANAGLLSRVTDAGYKQLPPELAQRFYDHLKHFYADRAKTNIHVAPFIFDLNPENVFYQEFVEEDDEGLGHEYHKLSHLVFVHENTVGEKTYPVFTEYFLLDGALYAYGTSWPTEDEDRNEFAMTFYVFKEEHGNPFGRGKYERSGKVFEERLRQVRTIYEGRRIVIPYNQYRATRDGRTALSFYWKLGFRFDDLGANNEVEAAMQLEDSQKFQKMADLANIYSSRGLSLYFPPIQRSEMRPFVKKSLYFAGGTAAGFLSAWLTHRHQAAPLIFLFGIYLAGDFLINTVAFRLSSVLRGRAEDEVKLRKAAQMALLFSAAFLPAFFYQPFIAQTVDGFGWQFPFAAAASTALKVAADLLIAGFLYYGYLFLEEWQGYGTPWKKSFYSWRDFIAEYKEAAFIWIVADTVAYTAGSYAGERMIPVVTSIIDLTATTLVLGLGYKDETVSETGQNRSESRTPPTTDEPKVLSGYEGLIEALNGKLSQKREGGFMLGVEGPSAIGKGFTSKILSGAMALSGHDVVVLEIDNFLRLDHEDVRRTQQHLINGGEHRTEWDFWDEDAALAVLKITREFLSEGKLPLALPPGVLLQVKEGSRENPLAIEITLERAWHRLKNEQGQNRYPEKILLSRDSVVIVDGKYNSRYELQYRQAHPEKKLLDLSIRLQDSWEAVREKYIWRVKAKYAREIAQNPGLVEDKAAIYRRSLEPSFEDYLKSFSLYPDIVLNVHGLWRPKADFEKKEPKTFSPEDVVLLPFSEIAIEAERNQKREAWRKHRLDLARYYIGAYPGRYRLLKEKHAARRSQSERQASATFRPNPKQILSSLLYDLLQVPVDESLEDKFWSLRESGASNARLRAALSVYLTGQIGSNHALLKKTLKQRVGGKRDRRVIYMLALAPALFQAALDFGFSRSGTSGGATYQDYEERLLSLWPQFDRQIRENFFQATGLKTEKKDSFMHFVSDPENWSRQDKIQLIQNTLNIVLGNFSPLAYQDHLSPLPDQMFRATLRADIGESRYPEDQDMLSADELGFALAQQENEDLGPDWDAAYRYRSEMRTSFKEVLFLSGAIFLGVKLGSTLGAYFTAFSLIYLGRAVFHMMTWKDADGRVDYMNPFSPRNEWELLRRLEDESRAEMAIQSPEQRGKKGAWKITARKEGNVVFALEEELSDWKKKSFGKRFLRVRQWQEGALNEVWFDDPVTQDEDEGLPVLAEKELALGEPVDFDHPETWVWARSEQRTAKFAQHTAIFIIKEKTNPARKVFDQITDGRSAWPYGEIKRGAADGEYRVTIWGKEDAAQDPAKKTLTTYFEGYGQVTPSRILKNIQDGLQEDVKLHVDGNTKPAGANIRTLDRPIHILEKGAQVVSRPASGASAKETLPRQKAIPASAKQIELASVSAANGEPLKTDVQLSGERIMSTLGISRAYFNKLRAMRGLVDTANSAEERAQRIWFALAPDERVASAAWFDFKRDDISEEILKQMQAGIWGWQVLLKDLGFEERYFSLTDVMTALAKLEATEKQLISWYYGITAPRENRDGHLLNEFGPWKTFLEETQTKTKALLLPAPEIREQSPATLASPSAPERKEATKHFRFAIELSAESPAAKRFLNQSGPDDFFSLSPHGRIVGADTLLDGKTIRFDIEFDDGLPGSLLENNSTVPNAQNILAALGIRSLDDKIIVVDGERVAATQLIFKKLKESAVIRVFAARSEVRTADDVEEARGARQSAALASAAAQFLQTSNQAVEIWLPELDFRVLSAPQLTEIEQTLTLYPKATVEIYGKNYAETKKLEAAQKLMGLFPGRVLFSDKSRVDGPEIRSRMLKLHFAKITAGPDWDDARHFRYEDDSAGLMITALLFSLTENPAGRSELRLSQMPMKYRVLAQSFWNFIVTQRVFLTSA